MQLRAIIYDLFLKEKENRNQAHAEGVLILHPRQVEHGHRL